MSRIKERILSLTCSSSGCERNWSAFEMVHTKKRNRLQQQRMNDLVFVMYNLKLKRRQEKRRSATIIQSPIVLDDLPSDDEWIAEIEDSVLPSDNQWLNDLDRAARRFTRSVAQTGGESAVGEPNDIGNENDNVEVQWLSDDDITATFDDSNEFDEGDLGGGEDGNIGATTTGTTTGTDMASDDGSFGYDE